MLIYNSRDTHVTKGEDLEMNFLQRAVKSIIRQFGKNVILLVLIFILSSIIAGSILAEGAIGATEANLRRRMPSIVSVGVDEERVIEEFYLTDEFPEYEMITADLVREIGELPYVRDFDYSIEAPLESFDLRAYGLGQPAGQVDFFHLTGVSNANLAHIEEGLIEVVGGRMLTDDEINVSNDYDIVPAFTSSSFAEVNQLQIGSIFTLSSMIVDFDQHLTWTEENLFAREDFQFEIVGLFDMVNDHEAELEVGRSGIVEGVHVTSRYLNIMNQIYVPNYATYEVERFRENAFNEMRNGNRSGGDFSPAIRSLFILEDPLYIENFKEAVEPLLPEYNAVADFSHAFADVSSSMESLGQIANWILWIAISATLLILILLITLFLRDRRYEMGIYLALGEKKVKIILQVFIEVVVVAFIGITLAVFTGNAALSEISRTMLRNELVELNNAHSAEGRSVAITGAGEISSMSFYIPGSNSLVGRGRGFSFKITPEELAEQFDVSLNTEVIFLIYGVGLTIIGVSTLVSVIYIIRLNPKKVLM